jgi:hypothetical protein
VKAIYQGLLQMPESALAGCNKPSAYKM